jgi:hypothetical protein
MFLEVRLLSRPSTRIRAIQPRSQPKLAACFRIWGRLRM